MIWTEWPSFCSSKFRPLFFSRKPTTWFTLQNVKNAKHKLLFIFFQTTVRFQDLSHGIFKLKYFPSTQTFVHNFELTNLKSQMVPLTNLDQRWRIELHEFYKLPLFFIKFLCLQKLLIPNLQVRSCLKFYLKYAKTSKCYVSEVIPCGSMGYCIQLASTMISSFLKVSITYCELCQTNS